MTDNRFRRLPVGIQSFKEIREENYLYVDKSDIVWNMVNLGDKYNYLSRPRRFGKSVLVDTLESYLEGRKDLFEGLKIMQLEKDWKQYPVIRLDMSLAGSTAQSIQSYLNDAFSTYESTYDITPLSTATLTVRFKNIVTTAYKETGNKVAILIDEYDSPLQHSWMTAEHTDCTDVYRNVFAVLKACDEFEKFVFITGITKFTQISLFSVLNNLSNISFMPEYAAICGITEEEMKENFMPELKKMSEANNWSVEETHDRLKAYYDGYHFCDENMVDIYNPYSLVNALNKHRISNFWASSGATSLLPKFVDNAELRMKNFENCRIMRNTLELSDVTGGGAELFLYQSGYLTIKDSDEFGYVLGFPNEEVKQALYEMVLPTLTMRERSDIQSIQANLYAQLGMGQIDDAMKSLKALIADVPYSNKKLASMDMEERYRLIISTILNAIGLSVEVEKMISTGRIDMTVKTSRYIYVIELKLRNNGGKDAATEQILNRQYMEPFKADKRKVIGLGIELDEEGKGLLDWKRAE
ncbi:ATP-binding protein [uncultured Prevotella sp.]|uniref:ATP-binding protein n=1 Tax=uncultured Prevotella sp. TaxID=159272 RepID=UPI0026166FBE|nr:ATP-binding protein [uncultured Prevotella sp.]